MDVREFPVLTEADQALVDRFAVGASDDAARVLAYLQRLYDGDEYDRTATATAIHIGTDVGRKTARDALADLSAAGVVAETSIRTATPGRPPKAWHAVARGSETLDRVYARHASALCRQAERVAALADAGFETDGDESTDAGAGSDADGAVATAVSADAANVAHGSSVDGVDPDSDPVPVSVGLNWAANGLHLPLFAARERRDRERTDGDANRAGRAPTPSPPGVSLSFTEHTGSLAAIDAVAAGEHDCCVAGPATLVRELGRGRPVVPAAVAFQRSPVVLYALRERFGEPFESVEQLRGRRVGTPANAETGLLGRLLLEQAGVSESVELIDVAGEERSALRSGVVDAVTGVGSDPDRLAADAPDRRVDVVAMSDQFPVYGPTLVAGRELLRERPGVLAAVLAEAMLGWADATADPATAAAGFAGGDGSPGRVAETFARANRRFGTSDAVRKRGWGWHSPAAWRDLRSALAQGGVIDGERG